MSRNGMTTAGMTLVGTVGAPASQASRVDRREESHPAGKVAKEVGAVGAGQSLLLLRLLLRLA